MANYTISIEDMLEMNKQEGESLDNLTDLCTIAKRALFNKCDLTVINEDFVDRFCTQFAIHYLDHEICCPSEFKWRIYLAGHVMENAELINSIFEELENQIFSDYNTRTVTTDIDETVHDDGTVENDGTVTNVKSGDDTVKHTGSATDGHTGTTGVSEHIDDVLTKSGSEIDTHDTEDHTITTGTVTTRDNTYTTDHTEDDTSAKSNSGSYGLDTPQDEIGNLRTDGSGNPYDASGKGIAAAAESKMNYMTSASLADGTTVNHGENTTTHDARGSYVEEEPDTDVEYTRGGHDTLSFSNRQDDRDIQKTTTNTYNETQSHTSNLQDKTEYNSEDTRTDDLLTTTHNTNSKDAHNVVTEVSNKLNWEMLMRCEAPMKKIWNAFDELFWPIW